MLKARVQSLFRKIFRPVTLWINRRKFEEVLVLGDSHATVFRNRKFKAYFPNHFFNIVTAWGGTVSGFKNPNTKTKTLPIFMKNLRSSIATTTIILIGEVDTGFVIWYRAEKYNVPVATTLATATENYQKLLMEISKKSRVICISVPMPTIRDDNIWGDVANIRKEVKATQRERTELTLQFNKQMQEFCEKNRFLYLSFDDESLGEDGLVDPYLLNSIRNNHHYDDEKYTDMIINRLTEFIK